MRDRLTRLGCRVLARELEHSIGPRCRTYDLDDFPEDPYQPRDGLHGRCARCWGWDIIDNLREYAR